MYFYTYHVIISKNTQATKKNFFGKFKHTIALVTNAEKMVNIAAVFRKRFKTTEVQETCKKKWYRGTFLLRKLMDGFYKDCSKRNCNLFFDKKNSAIGQSWQNERLIIREAAIIKKWPKETFICNIFLVFVVFLVLICTMRLY